MVGSTSKMPAIIGQGPDVYSCLGYDPWSVLLGDDCK
ncbi:hypothetical protein L483_03955 [Pseudomonas putida H8234]|nr:hypothetical protein L483_03955 [Pseudomonas putida H8234]